MKSRKITNPRMGQAGDTPHLRTRAMMPASAATSTATTSAWPAKLTEVPHTTAASNQIEAAAAAMAAAIPSESYTVETPSCSLLNLAVHH